MQKLLDTSKRHRRTTPIPTSPQPDMSKLLHTGAAVGRKRRRIVSGMSESSALAPPADARSAMVVDPPQVHFQPPAPLVPSSSRDARSPSLEFVAGPYPQTNPRPAPRRSVPKIIVPAPPVKALPPDPPTSPMHFSSASEESSGSDDDSIATAHPPTPKLTGSGLAAPPPPLQPATHGGRKRSRSVSPPRAGPSTLPYTHPVAPTVPSASPAPDSSQPRPSRSRRTQPLNRGKGKAVVADTTVRDSWPSPLPLSPQPNPNPGIAPSQPLHGQTATDFGSGMNPAAWHPYTGGGPGLARSADRFEQMLNATRENEQRFLEKVRVCSFCFTRLSHRFQMHRMTLTPGNPAADHLVNAYNNIQADRRRNLNTLNFVMEARDRMKYTLEKVDACIDCMMSSRGVHMPEKNK